MKFAVLFLIAYAVIVLSCFNGEKKKQKREEELMRQAELKAEIKKANKENYQACVDGKEIRNYDRNLRRLKNTGNWCFVNSVVQALMNNQNTFNFFVHLFSCEPKIKFGDDSWLWQFVSLASYMVVRPQPTTRTKRAIVLLAQHLHELVAAFHGEPYTPEGTKQDAHELLLTVLNKLHTEITELSGKTDSVITSEFYGILQSERSVQPAKAQPEDFDEALSSNVITEDYSVVSLRIKQEHIHQLKDALIEYSLPETIPNFMHDGKMVSATKQYKFVTLPPTLILHLDFLSENEEHKIVKKIDYPNSTLILPEETLAPDFTGVNRYTLTSVIFHYGENSTTDGHYATYVRHRSVWYLLDDQLVLEEEPPQTFSEEWKEMPYLLFYSRTEDLEGH